MALFTHARLALLGLATSAGSIFAQSAPVKPAAPVAPVEPLTAPAAVPCADATPALPPYGGTFCERPGLTGDWFGHREKLRDCGYTLNAYSTTFYQGVADGGLNNNYQTGGRFDLLLNIDGEKAGLWKGSFITLHDETIYGKNVNFATGALLPVSTGQVVPIPNGSVNALTGIQFTQFLSESFGVFAGKINTLDGFKQPYAGYRGVDGFMGMAYNFPVVAARTIPYSTWGGGFVVMKDKEPVFTFMALDTNDTPTTTGFPTFFDNGVSLVAQANLPTKFFGMKGHQGIGGSYSNRRYSNLDNLPYIIVQSLRPNLPAAPQETGSWNVFYMFDQTVGYFCCDEKRSWGLFGNAGISDGNPNPIRWSANVGLGGSVPFATRPLDSFGVGYYYLGLSDSLKNAAPRVLPLRDEDGIEAYYTVGVTPWCKISADIQAINPTRSRVADPFVFGLRAKIDF